MTSSIVAFVAGVLLVALGIRFIVKSDITSGIVFIILGIAQFANGYIYYKKAQKEC